MNERLASLSANRLSFSYGETEILHDIDVSIAAGKITTLVGANGCGKSTLLRNLARLLVPSGGQVTLLGADLHHLPAREVAQKLAILPQGPTAPEGLSVRDLVHFGRHPHRGGLFGKASAEDEAKVNWALQQTNMLEHEGRGLDALSGGQRQRAWIALSLAQDTPILLLDEPTTYLDACHQLEILELVCRLNREHGTTVVMVLHDLNQAIRYSDEIIALKDGRFYAQGHPSEVMTDALLRDVFRLRAHRLTDPDTGRPHVIPWGVAEDQL